MLYNDDEKITYGEVYRWGKEQLAEAGILEAAFDARLLLEGRCGTDRNTLLVHGDRTLSAAEFESYRSDIARRKEHIPLQHITGQQEFMGLTFLVNENVLVPRQDTEVLVEEVMRHFSDGMHILDMCTGSGCILISLLHYSNNCSGVGVDRSEEALHVAKKNGTGILGERGEDGPVRWVRSDLFAELDSGERFDVIVSNPPYIKTSVIDTLMPEVKDHEPRMALDGQEDGLFFYREITAQAGEYLTGGGMLFFEIGYDQGEAVSGLMEEAGYREIEVVRDFAGLDRVVYGVWPG